MTQSRTLNATASVARNPKTRLGAVANKAQDPAQVRAFCDCNGRGQAGLLSQFWTARVLLTVILFGFAAAPAAAQSEEIEYYALDALKSVRVVFNASGVQQRRMDYGPFGENLRAADKLPQQQFAQLERDAESGQDYARARTYSSATGRFNRPDPVSGILTDPQSWNRYVYARNCPGVYVDPNGLLYVEVRGTVDPVWTIVTKVNWTNTPGSPGGTGSNGNGGDDEGEQGGTANSQNKDDKKDEKTKNGLREIRGRIGPKSS
jgi:RHS repeat-associated protein